MQVRRKISQQSTVCYEKKKKNCFVLVEECLDDQNKIYWGWIHFKAFNHLPGRVLNIGSMTQMDYLDILEHFTFLSNTWNISTVNDLLWKREKKNHDHRSNLVEMLAFYWATTTKNVSYYESLTGKKKPYQALWDISNIKVVKIWKL